MSKFSSRTAPLAILSIISLGLFGFYVTSQLELESLYERYNDKLVQNQVMNDVVRQLLHEAGVPAAEAWDIANAVERLAPQTRGAHGLESKEVLAIARTSVGKESLRLGSLD